MLTLEDFSYLLRRLRRDSDSPTGEALRQVFVNGKIPGDAIRHTGVPMVRFGPVYDEARRIAKALTLDESDGFTAAELPLANRALSAARAKETQFAPSLTDYVALEHLTKLGGKALKAVSGTVDQLPQVRISTLWGLEAQGIVSAQNVGGPVFEWTITDKGVTVRKERFR